MKKNILNGNLLYGQSGGPTSVINSSAYGLFISAFKRKEIKNIYAMKYGIEGLLSQDIIKIEKNNNLKKLLNTPGASFGSNRYKLKDFNIDDSEYKKILEIFKKHNIRYFFYNGGNDSMDTINKISKFLMMNNYECRCIGINKTIDNDLEGTDFTLGYPSAAKFIINSCIEIYYDAMSYKKGRVNIIETMGRNAGFLAASSIVSKIKGVEIDMIYTPEMIFEIDKFLKDVEDIYKKKGHCFVVVSEGIKNSEGDLVAKMTNIKDAFGHEQLGGVSSKLTSLVTSKLNIPTRYFEFSLLQRAGSMCLSNIEQKIALDLSKFALNSAINGENAKVVLIKRVSDKPYKYKLYLSDIDTVANEEKLLDRRYIDYENNMIKDEYIDYLLPLIDGKDGLLDVIDFRK